MYSINKYTDTMPRVVKLLSQYKEHGSLVLGVDFDFTLWDGIDKVYYTDISDIIIQAQTLNFKVCLWTANVKRLNRIQDKCAEHGLVFDYINESPIDLGENTVKPHFNLLLDDTAGLGQALAVLIELIKRIKEIKCNQQ